MTSAKILFCAGVASLSLSACANRLPTDDAASLDISKGDPIVGLTGARDVHAPAPAYLDRATGDFRIAEHKG